MTKEEIIELAYNLDEDSLNDLWKRVAKRNREKEAENLKKIKQKDLVDLKAKLKEFKNYEKTYSKLKKSVNDEASRIADEFDVFEYDVFVKAGHKDGYI